MGENVMSKQTQRQAVETLYKKELDFLKVWDKGSRPKGWQLTPRAAVKFILGGEKLSLPKGTKTPAKIPKSLQITRKFVGNTSLVERCVVTLAGERGLILVGEPGTAKSMLSELLAAAISNNSALTVQGTAGTIEEHFRYSWNYSLLLAEGYSTKALTPSVVLQGMRQGSVVRIEEITRCLPEVQDALISLLSERRLVVPEIEDNSGNSLIEYAQQGFNIIATANLRDKGVSEMSAALKRRFNFENVHPIADQQQEADLIRSQATAYLTNEQLAFELHDVLLNALVTCFRDLRSGITEEGWNVERPSAIMSTAEAVSIACSLSRKQSYFASAKDIVRDLPGYIKGVVIKDEPKDADKILRYWDGPVLERTKRNERIWEQLYELRDELSSTTPT